MAVLEAKQAADRKLLERLEADVEQLDDRAAASRAVQAARSAAASEREAVRNTRITRALAALAIAGQILTSLHPWTHG